jgi:hypothetical protein
MKFVNPRHALSRNVHDACAAKLLTDSVDAGHMGWQFVLCAGGIGRGSAEILCDIWEAVAIRARWCCGLVPRFGPSACSRKSRGRVTAAGIYRAKPDAEAVQ